MERCLLYKLNFFSYKKIYAELEQCMIRMYMVTVVFVWPAGWHLTIVLHGKLFKTNCAHESNLHKNFSVDESDCSTHVKEHYCN